MSYRMSYSLRVGPPKPADDLAPDEGLTDTVLFVSFLGVPGEASPTSAQVWQFGPEGVEAVSPLHAVAVGSVFLHIAAQSGNRHAVAAMAAFRRSMGLLDPGAPI